jgi:DNA-directed RNA polymerase specialized sigma24 family protein
LEASYDNEEDLSSFISSYQQKIFALAFYLIGGDRDKAYDIASSSFAEVLRAASHLEQKGVLLSRIAGIVVQKSRAVKTIPVFDNTDFIDSAPEDKETLRILRTALQRLSFDLRALLLLREQVNLRYKDIAPIFRTSENNIRVQTTQARIQLRKIIVEVLNRAG